VIALDPWLLGAYQGLAVLAQARGDSATAISIWSRLSGLYPDISSLRLGLIQAYLDAGQPGRAYWALDSLPRSGQGDRRRQVLAGHRTASPELSRRGGAGLSQEPGSAPRRRRLGLGRSGVRDGPDETLPRSHCRIRIGQKDQSDS